jgi:hypothetical protein
VDAAAEENDLIRKGEKIGKRRRRTKVRKYSCKEECDNVDIPLLEGEEAKRT